MNNIYFDMVGKINADILEKQGEIHTFREIVRKNRKNKIGRLALETICLLMREIEEEKCSRRYYMNTGRKLSRLLKQSEKEESQSSPQV